MSAYDPFNHVSELERERDLYKRKCEIYEKAFADQYKIDPYLGAGANGDGLLNAESESEPLYILKLAFGDIIDAALKEAQELDK